MNFLVVGCSYRTAEVGIREQLAYSEEELSRVLPELYDLPDVQEVMLLSTCNRVEIWAASGRPRHAGHTLVEFLARDRGVEQAQVDKALYRYQRTDALTHIFKVTSSLAAMVVGEPQIAGQVKAAFAAASREGTLGPLLNRCLHRAFGTAKHIRTETDIARHPVSISSVAADLAGRVFGNIADSRVLVVGAGEMAELAVRRLLTDGATSIQVINRSRERAQELAFHLGAKAHEWSELRGQLLLADIVISSTGSKEPVISRQLILEVMRQRRQKPMFVVDIAVPRDVEREVGTLPNVYLFDIDDLEQVSAENLKERRKEARAAEGILNREVAHFEDWMRMQDAVPVIKDLRQHFSDVVHSEVERTRHALHLDAGEQQRLLDTMADAIVKKLLHVPTMELKNHAARSDGVFLARSARHLFHLTSGEPEGATQEEPQGSQKQPALQDGDGRLANSGKEH